MNTQDQIDALMLARARLDADGWISVADIAALTGQAVRTVWEQVQAGKFPAPTHRLTKRTVRWSAAIVREQLNATTARRARAA